MTSYLRSLSFSTIAPDTEFSIFFDPVKWNDPLCAIGQFRHFMDVETLVINKQRGRKHVPRELQPLSIWNLPHLTYRALGSHVLWVHVEISGYLWIRKILIDISYNLTKPQKNIPELLNLLNLWYEIGCLDLISMHSD